MASFEHKRDHETGGEWLETSLDGVEILNTPLLNKGCAFDQSERDQLGLVGLMPDRIETLDDQLARELEQYESFETPLGKNVYLGELRDRNEVLYFRLALEHVGEMLPILYTPEVGVAVEQYSHIYRRPRGLYISYGDADRIDEILSQRSCEQADVVVVTDSSAILGIGDQGVGGMGIPVAKLALDSLCGAVSPMRTVPITLDVGTDNSKLLSDPLYMGWRHERVTGSDYDRFIDRFVQALERAMPGVFLHWEDFARDVAEKNLERYRDRVCSFNDDIQGTAAVCSSALLAALDVAGEKIENQRVVIFGAGAAGLGNAGGIVDAMVRAGLKPSDARARIWALDRYGLVVEGVDANTPAQQVYARPVAEVADWKRNEKGAIDLVETAARIRPTVMIGTSGQAGAFSEPIVRGMAATTRHPIVFPLSNPTSRAEAHPGDLLAWTEGRALIATGSPFDPVDYRGKRVRIGQSNNAFVFPGLTLGVVAAKATRVTDNMLWAAAQALGRLSPARRDLAAGLLPDIASIRSVCREVGAAVAGAAVEDGVARMPKDRTVDQAIASQLWEPAYLPIRRTRPRAEVG